MASAVVTLAASGEQPADATSERVLSVSADGIYAMASGAEPSTELSKLAAPQVRLAAPYSPFTEPAQTVGDSVYYTAVELAGGSYAAPSEVLEPGTPLGSPSLRRVDLTSGVDELVAERIAGVAASRDGRLAMMRLDDPTVRTNTPRTGRIYVFDPATGATDPWSETGEWNLVGWSGSTVLATAYANDGGLDLYALDAGAKPRLLAADAGVVAADPDSELVLIQRATAGEARVALIDVTTGDSSTKTVLADPSGEPLGALEFGGDWSGDTILAATKTTGGAPGVAVVQVTGNELSVLNVVTFEPASFPWGVTHPRFGSEPGSMFASALVTPQGIGAEGTSEMWLISCAKSACTSAPTGTQDIVVLRSGMNRKPTEADVATDERPRSTVATTAPRPATTVAPTTSTVRRSTTTTPIDQSTTTAPQEPSTSTTEASNR